LTPSRSRTAFGMVTCPFDVKVLFGIAVLSLQGHDSRA
jgi:hypothetical protein